MIDKDEICNFQHIIKNNDENISVSNSKPLKDNTYSVFDKISKEFNRKGSKERKNHLVSPYNPVKSLLGNTNYESSMVNLSLTSTTNNQELFNNNLLSKLLTYEHEIKALVTENISLQVEVNELKIKLIKESKNINTNKRKTSQIQQNQHENQTTLHNISSNSNKSIESLNIKNDYKEEFKDKYQTVLDEQKRLLSIIQTNDKDEEISDNDEFLSKAKPKKSTLSNTSIKLLVEEVNKIKADFFSLFELISSVIPIPNTRKETVDDNEKPIVNPGSFDEIHNSIDEMKNLEKNIRDYISSNNYINTQKANSQLNEKEKDEKEKEGSNENVDDNDDITLPDIKLFFQLKGKVILVDKEFNLWQLEACSEYKKFCEENKNLFNNHKKKLFYAFIGQEEESDEEEESQINKKERTNEKDELKEEDKMIFDEINVEKNDYSLSENE